MDYVADGAAYRDCIANISEGGAFIETSNVLEAGSRITLSFSLFEDRQPVKIVGEVAWAGPTGVGVRFHQNQVVAQFCSQAEDFQGHQPHGTEMLRAPGHPRSDRLARGTRPYRALASIGATAPLWIALSLVVALVAVSRYDTNARIDAVADKVDRAAQNLVQLQSIAAAGAIKTSHRTPLQASAQPAPVAPKQSSEWTPVRAEVRALHAEIPATAPASRQQASVEGSPSTDTSRLPDEVYVVQAGDNLYQIARRFDTSRKVLTEYNGLSEPNRILVGQRIRIPK